EPVVDGAQEAPAIDGEPRPHPPKYTVLPRALPPPHGQGLSAIGPRSVGTSLNSSSRPNARVPSSASSIRVITFPPEGESTSPKPLLRRARSPACNSPSRQKAVTPRLADDWVGGVVAVQVGALPYRAVGQEDAEVHPRGQAVLHLDAPHLPLLREAS